MDRLLYIASCALVFVGLFAIGLWFYRPRIEADLTLRTEEALRKGSFLVKSVRFEGRDGLIEVNGAEAPAVRAKVAQVFGVRVVKVQSEKPELAPPRISLRRLGETIHLSGVVANEGRRLALAAEVRELFDGFKVVSEWEAGEQAADPGYLSELTDLFRLLASVGPEGNLVLRDGRVLIEGQVASEGSRREITEAAKASLPKGLELALDLRVPAPAPKAEGDRSVAAEVASSRLLFEFDSIQLTKESAAQAESLVEVIKGSSSPLRILGHTDSIGSEEYNQKLSVRRANKIRELFQREGVSSRTEVKGLGESRAIATNQTAEGRAANRRVEIEVIEGG
jgi:outer membrane protein OmpA-like peptidoglycan-associated protein